MAEERLDPYAIDNRWTADHLVRYRYAANFVNDREVLDAACGLGFGAGIMETAHAKRVVGVDYDSQTIARAGAVYGSDTVSFRCLDLCSENESHLELGTFDVVTSFETLEHLEKPSVAVSKFSDLLRPDGVLLLSVPGPKDKEETNTFHRQHFEIEHLKLLLAEHFKNLSILNQRFTVASVLQSQFAEGDEGKIDACLLDRPQSPPWSYFVIATKDGKSRFGPQMFAGASFKACEGEFLYVGEMEKHASRIQNEYARLLEQYERLDAEYYSLQTRSEALQEEISKQASQMEESRINESRQLETAERLFFQYERLREAYENLDEEYRKLWRVQEGTGQYAAEVERRLADSDKLFSAYNALNGEFEALQTVQRSTQEYATSLEQLLKEGYLREESQHSTYSRLQSDYRDLAALFDDLLMQYNTLHQQFVRSSDTAKDAIADWEALHVEYRKLSKAYDELQEYCRKLL